MSGAAAGFINVPGPRVKGVLMGGDVHHLRIVIEDVLRAVAVVHVKVNDEYAFQLVFGQGIVSGNSYIIK